MKKTITAYVHDRLFTGMPDEDVDCVTNVNYSFALIKDGRADVSHWIHEKELMDLISGHPQLSVCLSVGGWAADGFSQAVATEAGRCRLADSIAELVRHYGFKGVDLDWEYPGNSIAGIEASPEDSRKYPLFVKLLREKLGRQCKITMAVGADQGCVDGIRYQDMADEIDQINVMSYDMAPWGREHPTTHHAALYRSAASGNQLYGELSVQALLKAGVPPEKLVLGIAFYGRCHTGVRPGDSGGLKQPHESDFPKTIPYRKIKDKLAAQARRYWDDEAGAAYVYDPEEEMFITYEDPDAIAYKTGYALENGLAGVMFWEYLGDDTRELLQAVYRGMVG